MFVRADRPQFRRFEKNLGLALAAALPLGRTLGADATSVASRSPAGKSRCTFSPSEGEPRSGTATTKPGPYLSTNIVQTGPNRVVWRGHSGGPKRADLP